jgi:NAD(P)H-dependent flavin oxidoreductase YrpB (nitropropane dioxygenase family)
LGIEVPIIQAGMGWDKEGMTTPPELVAAVSNAGGSAASAEARSGRKSFASGSVR